jgi:tRNA pseudouridine65 synthase
MQLEILYQDDYFVAINKPHGLLVHRTRIAADAEEFALQILKQQLNRYVYPIHRLDRKTSGVLLFAFNKETTTNLQAQLQSKATQKQYLALVRGFFPDEVIADRPLTNDRGKTQEAYTRFECLRHIEIPVPFRMFDTSRYSLIKAYPKTGRMHQIRKHCYQLRHPIIGDRPHGCNKQNKLFKEKWQLTSMLLHAQSIHLKRTDTNENITITAPLSAEFNRMLAIFDNY